MAISKILTILASIFCAGIAAADPIELQNGVALTGLSGARYSETVYKITVPEGETLLEIKTSGGSGDVDLYVKFGSAPTRTSYQCRPYRWGNNETCKFENPQDGDWYIMLRAYSNYSGVTLLAKSTAQAGTVANPTFSKPSGTYTDPNFLVSLATTTDDAIVRYTLDGSDPTESSELFSRPISITQTTTVKAKGFLDGWEPSAIVSATYVIATITTTELENGVPKTNLSGAYQSKTYFKIHVPSGQTKLVIKISGGSGDCDLYVNKNSNPTLTDWDYRPYLSGNNETVTINNPSSGDWYIMLRGYSAYSGVTLLATYSYDGGGGGGGGGGDTLPDLTVYAPSIKPRTSTSTFSSSSCTVTEGHLLAGTRRLLRFTTETRNISDFDLHIGSPSNDDRFEWASCHGHYHFAHFAEYRLLNLDGSVAAVSSKTGFCIEDVKKFDSSANSFAEYNCSNQGLQAGWADLYTSNLPGQWIDITGLAPGDYLLELELDPQNIIEELNDNNNTACIKVTIKSYNESLLTTGPCP